MIMKDKTFEDATEIDAALGLDSPGFDFNFNAPNFEDAEDAELALAIKASLMEQEEKKE